MPARFFFAGELGYVAEGMIKVWVIGAEVGHQFVTNAVAGVMGVGVGGVLTPSLILFAKIGFDLGAPGAEEGTDDFAGLFLCGKDDGVDCTKAIRPGSTQELHQDGLGLIVERVSGEDGVDLT